MAGDEYSWFLQRIDCLLWNMCGKRKRRDHGLIIESWRWVSMTFFQLIYFPFSCIYLHVFIWRVIIRLVSLLALNTDGRMVLALKRQLSATDKNMSIMYWHGLKDKWTTKKFSPPQVCLSNEYGVNTLFCLCMQHVRVCFLFLHVFAF